MFGWLEILGEFDGKSTCSDVCIYGSDDKNNDGSLLVSMDGFTDIYNDGKSDSTLLGSELLIDNGCIIKRRRCNIRFLGWVGNWKNDWHCR